MRCAKLNEHVKGDAAEVDVESTEDVPFTSTARGMVICVSTWFTGKCGLSQPGRDIGRTMRTILLVPDRRSIVKPEEFLLRRTSWADELQGNFFKHEACTCCKIELSSFLQAPRTPLSGHSSHHNCPSLAFTDASQALVCLLCTQPVCRNHVHTLFDSSNSTLSQLLSATK